MTTTMGTLVTVTCLLSTLITLGHSLTCIVCRTEGGDFNCNGEEVNCPRDYVCASTSQVTIMEGHMTKSFFRSCQKRSNCGVAGTIVYNKGHFKTATSCCYSDACSPSSPALPQDSTRRNGLSCRSCTSMDSNWCHTPDTIECTGEENKCILQTDVYSGKKDSKNAVRGCGTKAVCDIGSQNYNFGPVQLKREITCSNNGRNLHANILLLGIGALLVYTLLL
ncbi:phospholipase A2 inhibitor and Ly6/PLAUR domain-containing protein-like [Hyperolius riggenbachi]|uniref:phospholipase A2 inhibitor and Ly6/PLAUR domain-containing protein-like n=1 Tax=Hyperolius riggenbachi TaxID=752182 RepID=UPI0035A2D6BD